MAMIEKGASARPFRPCIDVHSGRVKQIVGSSLSGNPERLRTNHEASAPPSEFAARYRDDNVPGGHVVMLSREEDSCAAAEDALSAFPGGLQCGGGIDPSNCERFLSAGASHVIVTSYVFHHGRIDERALVHMQSSTGKDRLVLDLSCRRASDGFLYVVTDRWQAFSDVAITQETIDQLGRECDELLVHGVDNEGLQLGIDIELVSLLGHASPVPVTYAGGVRSLDDLNAIRSAGSRRVDVTVGSALDIFGGPLPYDDVLQWHRRHAEVRPHHATDRDSESGGAEKNS
jgi:phosphoribosylformimino-5-aminoimidazole carboxamide ribotide isomerase